MHNTKLSFTSTPTLSCLDISRTAANHKMLNCSYKNNVNLYNGQFRIDYLVCNLVEAFLVLATLLLVL